MSRPCVSVVSPVYKAEMIVDELVRRVTAAVGRVTSDFEIILVEDRSPDASWERIRENCARDLRIKGIRLSKNSGQHSAIAAGIKAASGEWVVVMDCDLQDNPDEIPALFAKAAEGFDSVIARREDRKDGFFKKLFSRVFYCLFSYLTETRQDPATANFGIYRRSVVEAITSIGDKVQYFPAMVQWVGFRRTYLPVQHCARFEGKTSYSVRRLFRLAIDVIINFSDKPLRLVVKLGIAISLASFLVGVFYLASYIRGDIQVAGFASLIISIWFLAGLVIMVLGVVGLYIGRTFGEVKKRPVYIVDESANI